MSIVMLKLIKSALCTVDIRPKTFTTDNLKLLGNTQLT